MTRDLERTRAAILDAAERLFADRGYRGASMQAIAEAAGLSRGMPGYVFGTKEQLYEAVLERAFAQPRQQVADARPASMRAGATDALTAWITAYLRFLAGHPTYVRLMQRAALDGGERLSKSPAGAAALAEGLAALERVKGDGALRIVDTRRLLVSMMALCFFPLANRDTVLAPLGLDTDDPDFTAGWVAHIVDLLARGALANTDTHDTGSRRRGPRPPR